MSLAALLALPLAAAAQAVGSAGPHASPRITGLRLAAVPATAPIAIAPAAAPPEDVPNAAPTPIFDVDPVPAAAPPQIGTQSSDQTEASQASEAGPTFASATAGIHSSSSHLSRQQMAALADNSGHSVLGTDGALMIVGGAGFIAGLIIGGGAGTAIAIAGAVVALYGLYLYLR